MLSLIDRYISQNNIEEALSECLRAKQYHLGLLIAKICQDTHKDVRFSQLLVNLYNATLQGQECTVESTLKVESVPEIKIEPAPKVEIIPKVVSSVKQPIRVMMYCNWCESKTLCDTWNKMSKGDYTWDNVRIVWEEPYDWVVVINCPPMTIFPDPAKTILFHMEPKMVERKHMWGDWAEPPAHMLKYCGTHEVGYNNNEWHLSKTYTDLMSEEIAKSDQLGMVLSTVLSDKYADPGHIKRIDFVKFLEGKNMVVHVFGGNKFFWKNYRGQLPAHQKDAAMFPYKYVFNAENHELRNYYTEKLIDGILAECLTFYWGCPNIRDYIDERAFVYLPLEDPEKAYQIVKQAMENNLWEQRLPYIRAAKEKILNELQFFPRLTRIVQS